FTYLHVREDIMQLYGFSDKEELALFTMLIGISGIGPKAALSVLSAFTPRAVALAIAGNDANELSKAKGIGKKTAQRIILELKDKFKELERESQSGEDKEHPENVVADEARTALMVLGYNPREAMKAVENCIEDNMTVEELIRKCLLDING
ncbi:MAG: Holliday junction branch migration protein RuvA, partial [Clostridia bacterium]